MATRLQKPIRWQFGVSAEVIAKRLRVEKLWPATDINC
jgi:hypothetical protein